MPPVAPARDLADPVAWRRSARASLARRADALRTRRRTRGSRSAAVLTGAALSLGASGALAKDAAAPRADRSVRAVQAALGIPADGISGPQTRRAVRAFQRRHGLTVDGIVGPQTRAALGLGSGRGKAAPRSSAPSQAAARADAGPLLESIALCESGGDPTAVSPDGTYRGKYQFTRETWRSMGGSGDPAAAPEAEQDRLAAKLLAAQGTAPWPACAKKIGA
jgi:hypothetical protein